MDKGADAYRRFLAGDDRGFVTVVSLYAEGLISFLSGMLGRREPAEDAAQETFARLYARRPAYRNEASFKTWLYTIGRRVALDEIRRTKRLVSTDEPPDGSPGEEDPVRTAEQNDVKRALLSAMDRLPAAQRDALTLTYFEGLSNKQTAKVLGKSAHAVENLVSRARAALKTELLREGITNEDL